MENLEKIVSLRQASKISGYHQDYLSSLVRKGEIKGKKMGSSWLTTEKEIQNYIFKQKIRHKNWIIKYFLSLKRVKTSFIYAFIFLVILSMGIYSYNKNYGVTEKEVKAETVNTGFADNNQLGIKEKLQF